MRRRIAVFSLALGLMLAVAGSARAHHSSALYFDYEAKRVTLTGTLTRLEWKNPHVQFFVDARNEKGVVETWSIESNPPNGMAHAKIGKALFVNAIGRTVTVEVSPARDGSRFGISRKVTFPDGTVVVTRK